MHFFKWMGVALLLVCGGWMGAMGVAFERKRVRQAEGFLTLLRVIRRQIECFSAPVAEILAGLEPALLEDCGVSEGATDLTGLLRQSDFCLSSEMWRQLSDFGEQLGGSGREEQLRCCEDCVSSLRSYSEGLRKELPRRLKVAFFMPFALFAALSLLLW